MPSKATAKDVARRAGVSRSAVSMVLNGHGAGNIAADKQEAIRRAAAELAYQPNRAAVNLRRQRTHTIGVVTDAIASHAFAGALLTGAAEAALARGYVPLVIDTGDDADRERQAVATLNERQVDGFLFAALSLRHWDLGDLTEAGTAVLADAIDPTDRVAAFAPDEVAGGRTACRELIDHGHTKITALVGAAGSLAAERRWQGHRDAMREAGLKPGRPVRTGWTIREGYEAAQRVLDRPDRPTAIACANDRVAVGVVLAALGLGLSVPGDLSVLGYDDDENVAPEMAPALTTVALPHHAMGWQAMTRLLDVLDGGPDEPGLTLLPGPLIRRDSVAPPR
ncbi:LacI family DNA-binding transcriptional regulator [Microlunatus parietis]|uniref:LacI family transcriptional regulator n=1 Tax=Microlunatus parietis TaxID=682979 RepID=A0A7Y9I8D3_9ACTN|nr:LacI family DNA-binding transcriptional regulator [Microlunatus parietis]NYE72204.1 LacI family transcriptional regulator [Microlunatus parietis]